MVGAACVVVVIVEGVTVVVGTEVVGIEVIVLGTEVVVGTEGILEWLLAASGNTGSLVIFGGSFFGCWACLEI